MEAARRHLSEVLSCENRTPVFDIRWWQDDGAREHGPEAAARLPGHERPWCGGAPGRAATASGRQACYRARAFIAFGTVASAIHASSRFVTITRWWLSTSMAYPTLPGTRKILRRRGRRAPRSRQASPGQDPHGTPTVGARLARNERVAPQREPLGLSSTIGSCRFVAASSSGARILASRSPPRRLTGHLLRGVA